MPPPSAVLGVAMPPRPIHRFQLTGGPAVMSHIVTIRTKVRDPAAVAAACTRMGLAAPTAGRAELYASQAEGLVVRLPGWTYPAVVDLGTGDVKFDTFEGRWGDRAHLD